MAVSTGTLLAAALESAGYIAQQTVLDQLMNMFRSIAGLLFTGSMFGAVFTLALMGNYRVWKWLFIGPALFSFVTLNRVTADGAQWALGAFKGDANEVPAIVGKEVSANVSWLFQMYNALISSIVQESARIITSSDVKRQLKFLSRARIMDDIFRYQLEEGDLRELILLGLQGQCGSELEAARKIALGNRDPEYRNALDYATSIVEYGENVGHKRTVIPSGPVRSYVKNMAQTLRDSTKRDPANEFWCSGTGKDFDLEKISKLDDAALEAYVGSPLSCREIWCWTGVGLTMKVRASQQDAARNNTNVKYTPQNIYEEIWQDIEAKLRPATTDLEQGPQRFNADVSMIPVIVAGVILRKTLTKDPRSQMFSQFANHSGVITKPEGFSLEGGPEVWQRISKISNQHEQAAALRYEAFHFAMILPYLQGLLLYALALMFPFFSVLLVIPGKAHGFLTWLALWAWIKCWDIGWALVMVADDVIWHLMPHNATINLRTDPQHGPIGVFEAAFDGDPAYSLATYYMLLGVMLYSVPMLSAQAVLGAKGAIAGLLINGIKAAGEKVGGHAADYVATEQVHRTNYIMEKYRAQQPMAQVRKLDAEIQRLQSQSSGKASMSAIKEWMAKNPYKSLDANKGALYFQATTNARVGMFNNPSPAGRADRQRMNRP